MSSFDLLALKEQTDFEGKKAKGLDGRGTIPSSFWESYSAMANTSGGLIGLGLTERADHTFEVSGLVDADKVRQQLWDLVNNPQKVSRNILGNSDVTVELVEGRHVLFVNVPRAGRKDKPVYVGGNPMTGTYRRNWTGDYVCSEIEVKRMLAEASDQPKDATLLEGYNLADVNLASLGAYRNVFASTYPTHSFLAEDDQGLLLNLGGWRRDRASGRQGLTLAGLLMFGRQEAILSYLPHYKIDYRELPEESTFRLTGERYIDRVHVDGTWSGNLSDFYRRVYPKLVADLKVPFAVSESYTRRAQSPVHEAIQEALVNCLIHADHYGTSGITILRRREGFEFRNPGDLRISKEQALRGGVSDCRNPALQAMIQMLGVGDRMGSGVPTIMKAWKAQHWRTPFLEEDGILNTVTLRLDMASLLPDEIIERLDGKFSDAFRSLPERDRMALVTAEVEGAVTNGRMQELCDDHPNDLTRMFRELVSRGFLDTNGAKRGTWYTVSKFGQVRAFPKENLEGSEFAPSSVESSSSSIESCQSSVESSGETSESTRLLQVGSVERALPANINTTTPQISSSDLDKIEVGSPAFHENYPVSASVASTPWRPADQVRAAIVEYCHEFRTLEEIARALNRQPTSIRSGYLRALIEEGLIEPKYPSLTHPMQAYRCTK